MSYLQLRAFRGIRKTVIALPSLETLRPAYRKQLASQEITNEEFIHKSTSRHHFAGGLNLRIRASELD
jgi:hypothetical protein